MTTVRGASESRGTRQPTAPLEEVDELDELDELLAAVEALLTPPELGALDVLVEVDPLPPPIADVCVEVVPPVEAEVIELFAAGVEPQAAFSARAAPTSPITQGCR